MHLLDQLIELMPRFTLGIFTLLPFFMAWIFSILLFKRLKKKAQYKNPLITFFSKVTNMSIMSMAIITLLGTIGVDISALITGLG
jgi:small-conductance mechanosensitive channel